MKHYKALMMAVAILLGTTFTSCLDSDGGSQQVSDIVTVSENWMTGGASLKSDFYGYTYVPTNPDVLKYTNTSTYFKRAYIIYSLVDGEEFIEGKTNYNVTIVGFLDLLGRKFCNPDTLTVNPGPGFYQLYDGYSVDNYLTFSFLTPTVNGVYLDFFDLYPQKAEGDVLYVKINQNKSFENSYRQDEALISFELPSMVQIRSDFPELEFFGSDQDSIKMVLVADKYGTTGEEIKSKEVRVRLRY